MPLETTQLPATVEPDLGDTYVSAFWEPLVREAIFSFPRSTAPGPSGLRASHLQDSVRRPGRGAPLVAALARLAHMWAHGMIPEGMGPALCGADLTPLRKKDGGVRPIAVGEILRRLVGKAILSTGVAKEEVSSLTPDQVGVGVPGAVETVGIGFATLLEHFGPHSNLWAMAQIDVQSAYQEVSRLYRVRSVIRPAFTIS